MACKCSTASARNLYEVFVAPRSRLQSTSYFHQRPHPVLQQRRHASFNRKKPPVKEQTPFNDPSKPIDEMIDGAVVKLVGEDNKLTSVKLDHLLTRIDRAKEVVRQMSADKDAPIVRITKKSDLVEEVKVKQMLGRQKPASHGTKELEISWTIDPHDLAYRLKKIEGWLAEGRIVEITIARKRSNRKATIEECNALLETLRNVLGTVKDASETASQGRVGGSFLLTLAGPEGDGTGRVETIKQGLAEKKAQKQKEKEERRAEADAKAQRRAEREEEYKKRRAQQS